jgi:sulfonate transport system substrate-binding protein
MVFKKNYNKKGEIIMNAKKLFWVVALIIVLSLVLSACKAPAKKSSDEPIRVGTMPSTVGTPLDYAMKKGWFEEAGLKVERIMFPTGAPINEALAAEQLDVALSGLASVYAVASGDVTWIGEINTASGLGVYVRPDSPILKEKGNIEGCPNVYGSAETLSGLTVLGPLGTSSQFNVVTWMELFGLKSSDYKMLSMDFGPATQAFLAGEGDAIAACPPYTYQIQDAGMINAAPLEETSGITLIDGILARKDFLDKRRDDVKKLLEVIYRAQEDLASDDQIFYDACMEYYNEHGRTYDDEQMRNEIKERDFVNKEYMTRPNYRFGAVLFGMGRFYVEDGKIPPENYENIAKGVDPSLLEEIYNIKIQIYEDK